MATGGRLMIVPTVLARWVFKFLATVEIASTKETLVVH